MIQITQEDTNVRLSIESNLGCNYIVRYNCGDVYYSRLLRDHLQAKMYNKLEAIRREAYEEGWRDKTKRKPKQTWFRGNW